MKLSNTMTMLDVLKLIKDIAGDDDTIGSDLLTSVYNMAGADDLADDSIETWVNSYPEDKRDKIKSLFAGPAVEVVKTKVEGGKNQPPEDIEDDDEVMQMLEQLANENSSTDEPASDEPADKDTSADEPASDEPADKDTSADEEQDETTRNIIAGLSNK